MTLAPQALKVAPPRIFVLTLFFLLLPAIHVRAASIEVGGGCTLAEAIANANNDNNGNNNGCTAGSGADTITLTSNITLSAALPAIASNITIEGENISISGNNAHRIFLINSGTVRINNLTLTRGKAITDGTFTSPGGAIYVGSGSAVVTISKSSFVNNVAPSDATCDSFGGAILALGSSITIEDSVFRGNRANFGAGVYVGGNTTGTIRRSSFTGHAHPANSSDHGCENGADYTIKIHGGEIRNVTISGNSMNGIDVRKNTTTISHSTIANNTSPSENFGAGLNQSHVNSSTSGRANLYNNIIANNTPKNCDADLAHSTWILAHSSNLIQARIVKNAQDEDEEVIDCTPAATYNDNPKLASFRGSPGYRPLIEGSPAIDAGASAHCPSTDIRGVSRPVGAACDLGSYEGFLALPRSGGGGGGAEATPTPDLMPGTVCADCPDLLAQGYSLRAHNGLDSGVQFRRVGANAIGDRSLLAAGFLDAIDVYGWAEQGVGVCFPGSGSLLFLDAAFSPRAQIPLSGYKQDGLTCADIDRPGTLLLLVGAPLAAGRLHSSVASARALNNCMVTTDAILNFRASPGGPRVHFVDRWGDEIAGWLPQGVTLTALERTADWFRVDYHGTQGWISAGHVTMHGACG